MTSVLVLGGGPDAEREVSLNSARAVGAALRASGRFVVHEATIGRITGAELAALKGDVVAPVLHGAFGEGGPLQDLLAASGRPYVGCRSRAARLAMDKVATKAAAMRAGLATSAFGVLNSADEEVPIDPPFVVKPVHDGSSVGLHVCRTREDWSRARQAVADDLRTRPGRAYFFEGFIAGRELTVGVLDGEPLPVIEIVPAAGVYDYDAKYIRNDTRYVVNPDLPGPLVALLGEQARALTNEIGVRHLARVDFLLDEEGTPWLLEVNTMPGFTDHSLVPMAARSVGLEMPALWARLVGLALRDGPG